MTSAAAALKSAKQIMFWSCSGWSYRQKTIIYICTLMICKHCWSKKLYLYMCPDYFDLYMHKHGPNTVHSRRVWIYNIFYINIDIYVSFYKNKNHLEMRQFFVLKKKSTRTKMYWRDLSKIIQFWLAFSKVIFFNIKILPLSLWLNLLFIYDKCFLKQITHTGLI